MKRVIYFTADWCQPCKTFGPRLAAFAKENSITVEKVDAQYNAAFAEKWHVSSLPTVLWLKDDVVKGVSVGAQADLRKYNEMIA